MKKQRNEMKNYYIFQMGQFVSLFGSRMTILGTALWVYKTTGEVLSASLLAISGQLPEILLNFFAGNISDRMNKKKIMLYADLLAAFCSGMMLVLLMSGHLTIMSVCLINVVYGISNAFQIPAVEVTISLIVSRENYARTSGVRSFCDAFITLFASPIAVAVYAFAGMKVIIIFDLVTFMFAFCSLLFLVKIPDTYTMESVGISLWQQSKQGLQYIKRQLEIKALIFYMFFVYFILSIYEIILMPMVLARTGDNDTKLAIVTTSIGIAGILGSIFVMKIKLPEKKVPIMIETMIYSFFICNNMLGIGRNVIIWTAAVFIGNFFMPLLFANADYLIRTKVPVEMQGRVFSARNTLQYLAILLGNFLGGILTDIIFEPFMKQKSEMAQYFSKFVGSESGSGIGLLYCMLALAGTVGGFCFWRNKSFRMLDEG